MFKRSSQQPVEILAQLCDVPFEFNSRNDALKQITHLGRQILHSHTCSIVLIDLERSVLTQIACSSSNPEVERLLQDQVVRLGDGQPGYWIQLERLNPESVEKVYNLDIDGQGVANPKTARLYGLISMLSCPLLIDGKQIGRFNSFTSRRNSFGKTQEHLIRMLARSTVITLEKFDRFQTSNRTLRTVTEVSDQLLATQRHEFRQQGHFSATKNDAQLIADNACQLLSVPVCILWRLDKDTSKLRVLAASANVDDEFRKLEISVDEPGIKRRLSRDITNIFNINNHQDIVNAVHLKRRGWVSLLCASLRGRDEQIGLLDVFTTEERPFTEWEKDSFRTFAKHTALSLQMGDLLEKAEGREKLEMLWEVMMDMSRAQSTKHLHDLFLKGALQLVKARNGLIRRLDYATGYTKVVTHSDDPSPKKIELKLGEGVTGKALEWKRTIRIGNLRSEEWKPIHVQAWEKAMMSELAVPIILTHAPILEGNPATPKSGKKALGVLNIESEAPDFFSEFDMKCLGSLSQYAALMIERLETDEKLSEIEKIESQIKDSAYDDVIQILMRAITETLGYEYVNLSLVEPELNCIRSKHVVGINKDQIEQFRKRAVHSLASHAVEAAVARSGQTIVPDPEGEPTNGKLIKEFHLNLLARVCVPIVEPSSNQVIGSLETGYKKEFRPDIYERDVRHLKRLVGYAAEAIQRRRSLILYYLSHELRSPTIGIRNNASFLSQRFKELDQYRIDAKLRDILTNCQMLLHRAAELEHVLRIKSRTKWKFEKTYVYKDIVIKTINELKEVAAEQNLDPSKMEYRVGDVDRIRVSTDKAKLNQVVYNLLINAIKYAEKDPNLFTVRVEVDENRDSFVLKFKDWGIGIKREYANKVFDDGFRAPEAQAIAAGTGLGLTISKVIMNQMGGDLKLVGISKPTEFHLTIPKQPRSATDDSHDRR